EPVKVLARPAGTAAGDYVGRPCHGIVVAEARCDMGVEAKLRYSGRCGLGRAIDHAGGKHEQEQKSDVFAPHSGLLWLGWFGRSSARQKCNERGGRSALEKR